MPVGCYSDNSVTYHKSLDLLFPRKETSKTNLNVPNQYLYIYLIIHKCVCEVYHFL